MPGQGATLCLPCPVMTYQDDEGAQSCMSCNLVNIRGAQACEGNYKVTNVGADPGFCQGGGPASEAESCQSSKIELPI